MPAECLPETAGLRSTDDWRTVAFAANPLDVTVDSDLVCDDPVTAAVERPSLARVSFTMDPWGRLNAGQIDAPFAKRYNGRWVRLAVNLVGTGVRDCAKAVDPYECYTNPYLIGNLRQTGEEWVPDYDGRLRLGEFPNGHIEGLKALAAEEWLDPLSNGWAKPEVTAIGRSEFYERPLDGVYQLDLQVTPDVRLSRIERVQVLMEVQYWVKQDWEQ